VCFGVCSFFFFFLLSLDCLSGEPFDAPHYPMGGGETPLKTPPEVPSAVGDGVVVQVGVFIEVGMVISVEVGVFIEVGMVISVEVGVVFGVGVLVRIGMVVSGVDVLVEVGVVV